MINFHIPNIVDYIDMNLALIDLINDNKKYFYDNIKIDGVYGVFGSPKINGGRIIKGTFVPLDVKKDIISKYNSRNVSIIYTFSNPYITENLLQDYYIKEDLEIANNGFNKIILRSDILRTFLRSQYPNYKLISSITDPRSNNPATFNNGNFDIYVANANLNNTETLINIINKQNIELLVNSQCIKNCPLEEEHYNAVGKNNIADNFIKPFICPYEENDDNDWNDLNFLKTRETFITVEDLYTKYKDAGFQYFKINGRTAGKKYVLDYYMYYMVKPEYKEEIRNILGKYI